MKNLRLKIFMAAMLLLAGATCFAKVGDHAVSESVGKDTSLKYSFSGGTVREDKQVQAVKWYTYDVAPESTLSFSCSCSDPDAYIVISTNVGYDMMTMKVQQKKSASLDIKVPAEKTINDAWAVWIRVYLHGVEVSGCSVRVQLRLSQQAKKEEKKPWKYEPEYPASCPVCGQEDSKIRFYDFFGEVSVRCNDDEDDAYEFADINYIIHGNDRIKTEEDSGAVLSLRDMSTFVIKPETIVIVDTEDGNINKLEMLIGCIIGNMKKTAEGKNLDIEMSECVAGRKGTIFALEETGSESKVYTFAGEMEVTSKKTGKKRSVMPGEFATVGTDGKIIMQKFNIEQEAGKLGISMDDIRNHYTNTEGTAAKAKGSGTQGRGTTSQGGSGSYSWSAPAGFMQMNAATFTLGVDKDVANPVESPAHRVTLTRSFIACDHEVTQKEFRSVMGTLPADVNDKGGYGDNYPVYNVNWYHAIAYCNKRSLVEGLTPCYTVSGISDWRGLSYSSIPTSSDTAWANASCNWDADGYRLPTEAEWEYAARAGVTTTGSRSWSGTGSEKDLAQYAWYSNGGKTHEVKGKKPNAGGLYDMSGNVQEWCWDGYESDRYTKDKGGVTDPEGGTAGSNRAARGGAWNSSASSASVSARDYYGSSSVRTYVGFRVFRTVQDEDVRASARDRSTDHFAQLSAPSFTMGVDKDVASSVESPAHRVNLTRGFLASDHEVTQKEFRSVMGTLPADVKNETGKGDDFPVYNVNWYHAIAYCNKRSLAEGLTPCYTVSGISDWRGLSYSSIPTSSDTAWANASCNWDADGYRLPTEAEWEYAARAGVTTTGSRSWSGTGNENDLGQYAWYGSSAMNHAVKSKKPNANGLYDMSGSVQEWCWDGYESDRYTKDKGGVTDPEGGTAGSNRAARGGAWNSSASSASVSARDYYGSSSVRTYVGFRVFRTVQDEDVVDALASKKSGSASFVRLGAGGFVMGVDSGVASSAESPAHRVSLTRGFRISDHEVTQAEFRAVMGTLPTDIKNETGKGDDFPVYNVSWYHAIAYCNKRSLAEGLIPCYTVKGVSDWGRLSYASIPTSSNTDWNAATCDFGANGYRLPTEAEWEYAARTGNSTTGSRIWSGTTDENALGQYAWYGSSAMNHAVRSKKPNENGLYDMSGSVQEWCWDVYESDRYTKDKGGVSNPEGGASGSNRAARGGAWNSSASSASVSARDYYGASSVRTYLGFRVVRTAR